MSDTARERAELYAHELIASFEREGNPPLYAVVNIEDSAKPEAFIDLVEQVSPGPYLELFARRQRLGWDTWGNEALEHVELSA